VSEEKIIEKAILGDEECIRIIIDKWYPIIRTFCYRCINNYTEAEDLTQEVFLKVVINFPKYNEKGKFKSWLFKIAANTCKDYYKHKSNEPIFSELENEMQNSELIEEDFSSNFIEKELLKSALCSLKYKYRESIILHYFHHFTLQEIGEILHVPKATVNTRIRRGLSQLNDILKEK
jgi:RNA polymerase sigma-70 factor (ECF subfamily)